ncbi:MAG: tyrosine-type recombinase/integrase [Lentisphaeria bacterium]|nr:tyrosine-type recombinase/integrase [Lentisphaeria bacterium]MBR7119934.1 tyrosine-type recombinase/integrase [Lentisphaeria bacterium]
MALRKRGKKGYYCAYFRTVMSRPDGTLKYATRTVNLGTDDLLAARAMEAELMRKNAAARLHQKATAHMIRLDIEAGLCPAKDLPVITRDKRRKRLKLTDALEVAGKYRKQGYSAVGIWNKFIRQTNFIYMDEVTAQDAFRYLDENCRSGKNFNNTKSALHTIFRLTLLESGMEDSPFSKIVNRKLDTIHQRPFTEEEFKRIYSAAPEPWKTASLIAWFTGLRKKDVFKLRWDLISSDVITTTPAKTARFGRSVQIPVHPQLAAVLSTLPHVSPEVLGAWQLSRKQFNESFASLLAKLGITATEQGIVNFNSFRDSFVTRCDAAGIPRHAIRGIVGHVSDEQTDLYSHDLHTARMVQQLPAVELDNLVKLV